jgi:D-alanine-D-alanine ligase
MTIQVEPDWWKTIFDEVYLLTDARSVCNSEVTCREVDLICQLLPIRPEHRILDLCGGHGRHSLEFSRRGFHRCTLLDYSAHLVACARTECTRNHAPIQSIRADARNTGLVSQSFDHVLILGNSLGYAAEPYADLQILVEAYRVLRPGGCLLVDVADGGAILSAFNANAWHEASDDMVVCRQREVHGSTIRAREVVLSKCRGLIRESCYAIRIYDSEDMTQLLEQAGFKAVRVLLEFSPHPAKGDYGFMNRRMVALAHRPS